MKGILASIVHIHVIVGGEQRSVITNKDVFANLAGLERYVIKTSTSAMTQTTLVILQLKIALTQMVRTNAFVRRDLKIRQAAAAPVR